MKKILIMAFESPGLYNDALIYESILEKYFDVKILMPKDVLESIKMLKDNISDIYFFLEMIFDVHIFDIEYRNKLIIFMPNQELFRDGFKLELINLVLCKTLIAKDMFDSLKKTYNYKYDTFYTKFTTYITEDLRNYPIIKDENLFISFAGKSPFKNIDVLVNAWIKNNGFMHIDPKIKLIITCYGHCMIQFMKSITTYFKIKFIKITGDIFKYKNMILYNVKLESEDYKKLITSANCAFCISRKEGYGHYINESRYFKTCILSVDAEPMNELVINKKNGLLVDIEKKSSVNKYNYQLYDVYPEYEDFKKKLIELIKNKKKLFEYGINGRKLYEDDKEYFYKEMENVVIPFMQEKIK
jgi:glycosyltransferase involved in cell wall biosynthesis